MGWTKRRKEKIVTRILVTATFAIIAIGALVALVAVLFPRVTGPVETQPATAPR
jgi:hypothetical protein